MAEFRDVIVTCPNGHRNRLSEVRTLKKSFETGDLGHLECPVPMCKRNWCFCEKHGEYPCPPPCSQGSH
jgi:hypothetical protein